MTTNTQKTMELVNMLPEEELPLINTLLSKIIRAWDPDFVKLTPFERKELEEAEAEIERGELLSEDEVWNS